MESKPIRILHIIGILVGGGVETVVMNYYKNIDHSKVQFDFVVHDNDKVDITDIVEKMGGRVYKIPAYYKNIFGFMYSIYNIVRENKYNIVHCHMTTLGIFSLLPSWLAGAKVRILHGHSTTVKSEIKRNLMKLVLRPFSTFVANRQFACSKIAACWLFGSDKNVEIIKNAIEVEKFQFNENYRNKLREELGLENKFIIGHIGRFMYQKNHEYLIQIFNNIVHKIPSAHLVLVGDGPLREHILQKIENLGLRKDVHKLYSLFDIFYFPSWYEGLGLVAIEAQAEKLPILMSNFIPDEAVVDNTLAKKLNITENDINLWINETEQIYQKSNNFISRIGVNDIISRNGYDIHKEVKRLEELYCEYSKG